METNTNLSAEAKLAISSAISLIVRIAELNRDISMLIADNQNLIRHQMSNDLITISDNLHECKGICSGVLEYIVSNDAIGFSNRSSK